MSDIRNKKSKKCKCCNTAISKSFRYIYDEEGRELNIEFLLFDCVGKKVSEKNGLDQAICTKCLLQLQQSYEFKKKCLEAVDESEESDDAEEADEVYELSCMNVGNVDNCDELDKEFDETDEATFEIVSISSMKNDVNESSDIEMKFIEVIDIVEDTDVVISPKSQLNDKLSTSLTLPTVKKKFAKNAPSHRIKLKTEVLVESKAIDVEKIRTSDDLVNILEDDYQSENDSNRKCFTDITDEFKIPKIEVEDFCDNIEYLDESKPMDLDEYIKLVTLISYDEKKCFISEVKCVVSCVLILL